MGLYWAGGYIVLGWRFHCTGLEVPLYWTELGRRFHCIGLYWAGVPLYWAGGSIVLGWRFRCAGLEVPLYWAGGSVVLGCTG